MKGNFKFDSELWRSKTLEEGVDLSYSLERRSLGTNICGPTSLMFNEYYRSCLAPEDVDFGKGIFTDLFVWSLGEPSERFVTKCGGLPYRSAKEHWPMSKEGRPMQLLGQFNFCDSVDLVGELPGEMLLIFGNNRRVGLEDGIYEFYTEWQNINIDHSDLVQELPDSLDVLQPCFGSICRRTVYPHGEFKCDGRGYPIIHGMEFFDLQSLTSFSAWQIGGAILPIQSSNASPDSKIICRINSLQPVLTEPYPWLNVPNGSGYEREQASCLMVGDLGCIDVFLEATGSVYVEEASY